MNFGSKMVIRKDIFTLTIFLNKAVIKDLIKNTNSQLS